MRNLDLSLSPSVVEFTMQPGKLVTQTFLIKNQGNTDLILTPKLRDFSSNGVNGQPVLAESSEFPYAQLQNSDRTLNQPFLLKANDTQQLVLALDPPEDAQEKDWYVALSVEAIPDSRSQITQQNGAAVSGQIVSNMIIRIAKTDQAPLKWNFELQGIPRFVDSLQSVVVQPVVHNESETAATPEMRVLALNWKGDIVWEQDALPERVLAQSTRHISAAQQRKDDPRSYQPTRFEFDPLFAVGAYTIRATIRNNAEGPKIVEQSFIAFPFSVLIAVLALGVGWLTLKQIYKQK